MGEVERIAKGLTPAQKVRLESFRIEPRQMGIGMTFLLPDMIRPVGINHTIFGPHYELNPLGQSVLEALTP